jgi:thiamine pyrophosphate-dependent acetolactate synthase large subunit-like protein
MVMIKTRSTFGFIVVIAIVGAATLLSIDTAMNVYAQNTTMPPVTAQQNQTADPQQIKNYLTQAIQALDSGNNTKAAEQVDLAEDQLEGMTGTESAEDDEDEEIEEGAGEDADEPGDIDTNDEEDTP